MSKLTKKQKKIQELKASLPASKLDAKQALEVLKKFAEENGSKKYDQTVELAVQLGIDTKANDQQVRASVSLPAGTGKTVRVAVVTKGEKVSEAKSAGAIKAGTEDLVKEIEGGWMEFDVLVASPD